jgi:sialidase-1
MKKILIALMLALPVLANGQESRGQVVFYPHASVPYRIPAIAQNRNGDIIYCTDWRPGGMDIGYGLVDQHYRILQADAEGTKGGKLSGFGDWSEEFILAKGSGVRTSPEYAFGDPCIVADRNSDEVMAITASGSQGNGMPTTSRENPLHVAQFRSHDGGQHWTKSEIITEDIYSLFDDRKSGKVKDLFCSSGRIMQSKVCKTGKYYRLYIALFVNCTDRVTNYVIYSDDFGKKWHILGGIDQEACPKGDEAKCEELPDGSVILSSRAGGGRYFNIFHYTNVSKGEGQWGKPVKSDDKNNGTASVKNACNGEFILVSSRRVKNRANVLLALQSVPLGPGRTNVGIYWKELPVSMSDLESCRNLTPEQLASDWDGHFQVTSLPSAYSTMVQLQDGRIAFAWEEKIKDIEYTMKFDILTLQEITSGLYEATAYPQSAAAKE